MQRPKDEIALITLPQRAKSLLGVNHAINIGLILNPRIRLS